MATDTLEIFGTEYTGVTGIIATDNNTISHSKKESYFHEVEEPEEAE